MEAKVFEGLEYLISYPDGFREDKKYPLVIFLHGAGTRGESIDRLQRKVKKRPGVFFGRKSLMSLRDNLFGMITAFSICGHPDALKLFEDFIKYYNNKLFLTDQNGYVCWWNHLLYISGGMDNLAFDSFYRKFEAFLLEEHNLVLPEVE